MYKIKFAFKIVNKYGFVKVPNWVSFFAEKYFSIKFASKY